MTGSVKPQHQQLIYDYLLETCAATDEEDLRALIKVLNEPLPLSFRINLHHSSAENIIKFLTEQPVFAANTYIFDNKAIDPPESVPWYPLPNAIWQMKCSKSTLSKSIMHDPVKRFHCFLQRHTETGAIDRQEVVSMLPVLFMSIEPQHTILDMCASPGSKTSQILDFLMVPKRESRCGLVIANDMDKKRGYMLVHRLSRNTLRNVVVTCFPGDQFPGLYSATGDLCTTNVFDRILCDVPCSGDGTLRKNKTLWSTWHIGQGITLHSMQIALAMRAAALLKPGGTMVYSTCSFNPVENEAVVAEVLRRCDGSLKIVDPFDTSNFLCGLKYRAGRIAWKVGWRAKKSNQKYSDVEESKHQWFTHYHQVPKDLRGHRILRSMFPSEQYCNDLTKAIRILPMDQNSGGFFVAVFRKIRDLPSWDSERVQLGLAPDEDYEFIPPEGYLCKLCEKPGHYLKKCPLYKLEEKSACSDAVNIRLETKVQRMSAQPKYDRISTQTWGALCHYYGFHCENNSLRESLWSRSAEASTISYLDPKIINTCLKGDDLNIVNMGLKVFVRLKEKQQIFYRPTEEGLSWMMQYMTKRVFCVPRSDFIVMLNSRLRIHLDQVSEMTQRLLEDLRNGPVIFRLEESLTASCTGSHSEVCAFNAFVLNKAVLPRVSAAFRIELQTILHGIKDTE